MNIAVCIKQVPDTETRLQVAPGGAWVDEDGLSFVMNESDEYALEEAITTASDRGGEVVAISLGPDRATKELRKALALGANKAIHLSDEAYLGGDARATARALAAVLRRENVDLVLTGSQSGDAGWGSTGTILAEMLGWPHAWLVMGLEVEDGGTAKVVREMESGMNEIFRVKLPAVIEVQAGINHPRYTTLKGIMKAKRMPIDTPSPADLGLDASDLGAAGSRVEVLEVAFPPAGKGAQILEGSPADAARTLVEKLQKEARVL